MGSRVLIWFSSICAFGEELVISWSRLRISELRRFLLYAVFGDWTSASAGGDFWHGWRVSQAKVWIGAPLNFVGLKIPVPSRLCFGFCPLWNLAYSFWVLHCAFQFYTLHRLTVMSGPLLWGPFWNQLHTHVGIAGFWAYFHCSGLRLVWICDLDLISNYLVFWISRI